MNRFDIFFIYDTKNQRKYPLIESGNNSSKIAINVFNLSMYNLKKELNKINSLTYFN